MRYRMRSRMEFTAVGWWGAALFVAGPIGGAVLLGLLAEHAAARFGTLGGNEEMVSFGVYALGFLTLCGVAMMLVGRRLLHEAVDDTDEDFDLFGKQPEWRWDGRAPKPDPFDTFAPRS